MSDERETLAQQIAQLEMELDSLPRSHPAWHALAHARKEWGHGLPETYAVARQDLERARKALAGTSRGVTAPKGER